MPRSINCSACPSKIRDSNYIVCKSDKCDKTFHLLCANVANLPIAGKETWICPDCQAAAKKGGDNSATPVRFQVLAAENIPAHKKGTQNRKAQEGTHKEVITSEEGLQALTSEIKLLRQDMIALKTDLCEAVSSLTRCHERLDEVTAKFAVTEKRLKDLEDQKGEVILLQATVAELENKLNNQAQAGLRNEVELVGVPEFSNENLIHILLVTATKIGVSLTEQDIDSVTRAGPRRVRDGDTDFLPRPLVARFCRKSKRDEFIKAARLRRNLSSKALEIDGPEQKLYVNDRLTRTNRLLFRETRLRAQKAGYKHCWTSNGSIFIRKQDNMGDGKSRSPAVVIRSERDLENIFVSAEKSGNN